MHIPGREGGSSQVLFRARGTPTMKLWSFDARSEGQSGDSPLVGIDALERVWISASGCSRLARNRLLRLLSKGTM